MPLDELFSRDMVDFSFAKPTEDRKEPLFWICEIRFLRNFSPALEDEIRRIEFRKGLNIIWAEAPTHSSPDDKQRISGHATGKTTLCRMIRYLLGESHMAAKNVASAISQKFQDGYVVGRFMVDGESWCVARSFMKIKGDFAEQSDSLDDFLKESQNKRSYHEFETKMESLVPKITPLTNLANKDELTFNHLLPWLTRDQDSQYTKLTEWRDNSLSDSGSPILAQKQSMLVMRSILDSHVAMEAELVSKQAELSDKQQERKKRINTLKEIIDYDEERIKKIGEKTDTATSLDEIYLAELHNRYEKILASTCLNADDESKLTRLQKKRDDLHCLYHAQAEQYNESLQAYRQHVRELKEFSKKESDNFIAEHLDEIQLAAQLHPTRKYCCAPLDVAQKEGCKIAQRYISDKDSASCYNLSNAVDEGLEKKQEVVRTFANFLKVERIRIDRLKAEWGESEMDLADFKVEIDGKRNSQAVEIGKILEAVKRYEEDLNARDALKNEYEEISSLHKKCTEQLAALRDEEKRSSFDIKNIYNDTIRFMLGNNVTGNVLFSAGEIELICSYNNASLSSAALNAVKNICFDLTAMILSIYAHGTHPRFLIHDGPRVSDLAATIFRYYFSLARELEVVANEEPNFQYIITTTEPPPTELQMAPWLVCKLDATQQDSRLLRCNL